MLTESQKNVALSIVDRAWFTIARAQSVPISGVKTKAKELSKEMGSNRMGHLEIDY